MSNSKRLLEAQAYNDQAMRCVKNTPEPINQKFPCGSRVRIADDLGSSMRSYLCSRLATVVHTYAHAFGGNNATSYCLDVDEQGLVAWFEEHQLSLIK